jgi:hypothetical protein
VSRAVARAVDWLLARRGYILDDGSTIAQMAHDAWDWWWSDQWRAPADATAMAAVRTAIAQPFLQATGIHHESVGDLAWVRPADHLIDYDGHTKWAPPATMAAHIISWSEPHVAHLMTGATWALEERPGGWASRVTSNGNNRSCEAVAAGLPLVRVQLSSIGRTSGRRFELHDPSEWRTEPPRAGAYGPRRPRPYKPRWSEASREQVDRLHTAGLCARPDWSQLDTQYTSDGHHRRTSIDPTTLVLDWVDPLFPWIIAERREVVDARRAAAKHRWGVS